MMSGLRKKGAMAVRESAVLPKLEMFQGLPEARLQAIGKGSEVQDFGAGHIFFHPGETGSVLYLLERGHVQTYRNLGEKKLIISELTPPAVFGEMGCVGQCVYHCVAQAMEASRVRTIQRKDLDALQDEFPMVTRRLLDLVSRRFVDVLLDLEGMSFRHLLPRLARLLLEKAESESVNNMTHKELAEHLRVYRESATTALGELRKAGIIAVERRRIRILDRKRLERAAQE